MQMQTVHFATPPTPLLLSCFAHSRSSTFLILPLAVRGYSSPTPSSPRNLPRPGMSLDSRRRQCVQFSPDESRTVLMTDPRSNVLTYRRRGHCSSVHVCSALDEDADRLPARASAEDLERAGKRPHLAEKRVRDRHDRRVRNAVHRQLAWTAQRACGSVVDAFTHDRVLDGHREEVLSAPDNDVLGPSDDAEIACSLL